MLRYVLTISIMVALTGCSSKYKADALDNPTSHLGKQDSFYIPLPAPGQYGGTTYPQSGTATALAIARALFVHVDRVEIGNSAGEEVSSALIQARLKGLTYVFHTTILNWEDRATEWSGIPDKITLKYAVYETSSGKLIASTVTRASSKWATFGGDHPEDLLPEPTKRFADALS